MPKRKVVNEETFYELINKYNTYKNIYVALYRCDENGEYSDVTIDKVFFDFDGDTCYNDILKLHNYLLENNYKHLLVFSGRGFHVYLFTIPRRLKNPKVALTNVHKHFIKLLELNLDTQIVGDVARMARVPNTFNIKRKKYCIPITRKDLMLGFEHIKKKADKQFFKYYYYGEKLFDITPFDTNKQYEADVLEIDEQTRVKIKEDEFLKTLPPCVANLLVKRVCGWKERYMIITFLRDLGYSLGDVREILRKFLDPQKYRHCVYTEKQDRYLFRRPELPFPKCETIKLNGLCPYKTKTKCHSLYK